MNSRYQRVIKSTLYILPGKEDMNWWHFHHNRNDAWRQRGQKRLSPPISRWMIRLQTLPPPEKENVWIHEYFASTESVEIKLVWDISVRLSVQQCHSDGERRLKRRAIIILMQRKTNPKKLYVLPNTKVHHKQAAGAAGIQKTAWNKNDNLSHNGRKNVDDDYYHRDSLKDGRNEINRTMEDSFRLPTFQKRDGKEEWEDFIFYLRKPELELGRVFKRPWNQGLTVSLRFPTFR